MAQKTYKESLGQFLLEINLNLDIEKIMQPIERIFYIADRGQWPLVEMGNIDYTAVAEAYAKATRIEINKIDCISISQPLPIPREMSEKECNKAIAIFWFNFRTKLRNSLWDSLGANLRDDLKESLEYNLWENLGHNLADNLWLSLLDSLKISLKTGLRNSLRDNLYLSLFYYLGFVLTNKPDQALKLIGLLNWYSQGLLFLGVKKEKPKTLLVVVK